MIEELKNELIKTYKEKFTKSAIIFSNACLSKDTTFMDLYLANDKTEVAYGYYNNDMFSISFRIKDLGNGQFLFENLAKSYKIRPTINKWLAYERTTLSFRKVQGNIDKITATFKKFVDKLEIALLEDIKNDLIHDEYKDLLNEKLVK